MLNAGLRVCQGTFCRLAMFFFVAALLGACASIQAGDGFAVPRDPSPGPLSEEGTVQPILNPATPVPLTHPDLDLRAGPVDIPLVLRIPSLQIDAAVLAVGITPENVMDAPKGAADDPVWQKAFWYRGSGIPGDPGTATIAGHVDDLLGRPAVFARLKDLETGDQIIVHDTFNSLDIEFTVDSIEIYSIQQTADPSILARIYGIGPVSGFGPQPAADGLAHLTLITCRWDYSTGTYDQRVVVYATRNEP